jgi:hypothetical protein
MVRYCGAACTELDWKAPEARSRQGGIEGRGARRAFAQGRLRHPGRDERRARIRHNAPNGSQDRCDVATLYPFRRDLSRERRGGPRDLNVRQGPGNGFSGPWHNRIGDNCFALIGDTWHQRLAACASSSRSRVSSVRNVCQIPNSIK